MRTFSQNNNYKRGTWKGLKLSTGQRSADFTCPDCGQLAALTHHTIDWKGGVNPSVVCPNNGCKFHEYILLEGWHDK